MVSSVRRLIYCKGLVSKRPLAFGNARLYREVEELYSKAEEQRQEIEKLYQTAEEQRQVAEVFGKMAFSAAANVHSLRNHMGAFRAFMQILAMVKDDPIQLREMLESTSRLCKAFGGCDERFWMACTNLGMKCRMSMWM